MEAETKIVNEPAERELIITRTINAPRELVFKAWTDPNHLIHWWGPKGFTNTFQEINISPGGVWRFIMHGPDGVDYPNMIVYIEIVVPKRLVYSHSSGEENDPGQFQVIVTFEEQGAKTKLTMRSIFVSAKERDKVVKEHGALEGANQTLDRLEEELKKMI